MAASTVLSQDESHRAATGLRALVISGLLLALPGGLLPLWGYHIQTDFARAGDYFLTIAAGLAAGVFFAQRYSAKIGARSPSYACFAATAALTVLAFAAPPAAVWFRFAGLFITGAAAGVLNSYTLEIIGPAWRANAAGVTLTAGIYFASGSALASVILAWCFEGANPPRLVFTLALVPALAGISMLRPRRLAAIPAAPASTPAPDPARQHRTVLALFFALLLFFQFANEWSIAGWLPVFAIDRLGISPQSAVDLLALYWLSLAAGRLGASRLLPRVRRGLLLAASAFCALFGCTALLATTRPFGTVVAILLAGMGFSTVYPLAAEKISTRFASYHARYFNGIFTFALLGGMLMPFVLGHAAADIGLRIVPLAAMIGSLAVVLLLLTIWLGRKVSGA